MTRPFAVCGLTLFFVMLALSFLPGVRYAAAAGAVFFVLLVCGLLHRKSRKAGYLPFACCGALLGCLLLIAFCTLQQQPALSFVRTRDVLVCEARDYPRPNSRGNRLLVTAKVTLEDGTRVPGFVQLSLPRHETDACNFASDVEPGDTIRFTGPLYALGGDNASVVRSFQSRSLFLGSYPVLNGSLQKNARPSPYMRLLRLRKDMIRTLQRSFLPDQASLLTAVLFGDKSQMSDALYDAFRRAGAAHIMAVSGMHLSAWVFFLLWLWKKRTRNLQTAGGVLLLVVLAVMALAGFSGSVLRAGLMMGVYLVGLLLRRRPDGLNSLGFAALVILCVRPGFCMHVGFILSVLSTLAILTFALPITQQIDRVITRRVRTQPLDRWLSAAAASVCISVCVTVVTLPVQIASFGAVSLVTVLTNLLLLPFLLPLLLLGGLFLLLHAVPVLGTVLRFLCEGVARYCIRIAKTMAALPYASLTLPKSAAVWAAVLTAAFCLAFLALRLKKRRLDLFEDFSII